MVVVVADTSDPPPPMTPATACASWASMKSPVNSISIACLRNTLRDNGTAGVEQNKP